MPDVGPTSPETRDEVVIVREVSKSFGEAHALQACSLTARAGEIHAVVGENGSGKSTLAKVIAGVLPPDSGSVTIGGSPPRSPLKAHELGVAVVFQEILIAEGGTVLDNLFLGHDGLVRARLSLRQKRARAQALLDRLVGSAVDLDRNVDLLPISTRQWIVIARALLLEPRVVVFDESTAALDRSSVERFFALVRELRDSEVCVLIVTHRIIEMTNICDRVTVLSDGRNVGTLEKGEITEERLLDLMSGGSWAKSSDQAARFESRQAARSDGREVLETTDLRLAPRAQPINLVVHAGEIVGLAGLEGQGQVEFIRAITGIRKPAGGQVHVTRDGHRHLIDSARAADRASVTYIPGDRKVEGTFPNLSILENFGIALYRRTARAGFIGRRKVSRMFLDQARSLSIRAQGGNAPINSLSGGNQQKIVIGRSLAASPLVLALNDPTRGVDIGTKHDLYALLHRLADEGRAVLFLSNEIEEFPALCDRVVVFRSQTVFTTVPGSDVTSDRILAAMFGYATPQPETADQLPGGDAA
jgi:ABC-type sugar transport system ATPase subunit